MTATAMSELEQLALDKMTSVLGAVRARKLLHQLCTSLRLELRTPEDLLRLSNEMTLLGGFEGAVGAMLGVSAVIRGASPKDSRG